MSTPSSFGTQDFRKSSRSDPEKNCVEVARSGGVAQVRDSKTAFGAADDGRLTVTGEQFDALLRAVRS